MAPSKTSLQLPAPSHASRGANPTLETLEYIRLVLKRAPGPISRNEILRILSRAGHGTTRQALNAALGFLGEDGSVVEGSKGLQWVYPAEGRILETIRRKTRSS